MPADGVVLIDQAVLADEAALIDEPALGDEVALSDDDLSLLDKRLIGIESSSR